MAWCHANFQAMPSYCLTLPSMQALTADDELRHLRKTKCTAALQASGAVAAGESLLQVCPGRFRLSFAYMPPWSVSRTCCSVLLQGSLPGIKTAADLLCIDRRVEGTSKYKYARISTRTRLHLCPLSHTHQARPHCTGCPHGHQSISAPTYSPTSALGVAHTFAPRTAHAEDEIEHICTTTGHVCPRDYCPHLHQVLGVQRVAHDSTLH